MEFSKLAEWLRDELQNEGIRFEPAHGEAQDTIVVPNDLAPWEYILIGNALSEYPNYMTFDYKGGTGIIADGG
jgi:hypothetical protein